MIKKLTITFIMGSILTSCGGGGGNSVNNVTPAILSVDLSTQITTPVNDEFLKGLENGLDISHPAQYRISIPQVVGRRTNNTNNADGFAYFALQDPSDITSRGDPFQYFFAGILSTTDLGKPLTQQPANASWAGHVSFSDALKNNFIDEPVDFSVNFSSGTFKGTNRVFIVTNGVTNGIDLSINGVFGNNPAASNLNDGEMGGMVTYRLDNNSNNSFEANLRGLIGEEGAVGVFVDNIFSGGFTATNPR